jgi:predicted  nucleic acid-binding Zn-ribbon protein
MRTEIEELRDRRDDLRDQLANEQDKENPDERRCDDLYDEIQELEERIEEIEHLARVREEEERERRR